MIKKLKKPDKEEIIRDLKIVTQISALYAINSDFIIFFCDFNFNHFKDKFKNNPANILMYQAFSALRNKSIVELSEWIEKWCSNFQIDKNSIFNGTNLNLLNMRDIISHPAHTILDFKNKNLTKFMAENKYNEISIDFVILALKSVYSDNELKEMIFKNNTQIASYVQNILLTSVNENSPDLISLYNDIDLVKRSYDSLTLRYFNEIVTKISKK
jgi:hypothetical protein